MKKLLDATFNAVAEVGEQMPENDRAALAVYCYRRGHFRELGLSLAAMCSRTSLVSEAGHAGEVIYAQAKNTSMKRDFASDSRSRGGKAPVSLHVV
ncbi:hypothetical protein [Roseibium aggregatum]|uniref:hypothetical protein n=1 Tax=Roseibium aggregatum TaxID=187304 RepID=UPI001AD8FA97|nr:hypothetical protein [Roseibium aggregatum]